MAAGEADARGEGVPADLGVGPETADTLERWGFDPVRFARLRERVRRGGATPAGNEVDGTVEPPAKEDLTPLPVVGTSEYRELAEVGSRALTEGKVGVVYLAGGMATRFGGVVKAGVEVVDGRSFLELKLADAGRVGRVPVHLMSSFATDEEVRRLAGAWAGGGHPPVVFPQGISVRLTPEGDVFRDDAGAPSLHAPGHGDLPEALRRSGALDRFRDAGGEVLFMSNIDNLGATLEPAVLGAHLVSDRRMTVEVVEKEPGDAGGAPTLVDGRLVLVEGFRFPSGFDQDRIGVFSTNTFWFDADVLDTDFDLTWCAVRKKVDGREAIQFERIVNEVTRWVDAQFLVVPRAGDHGRFQPVKDPAELDRRRPDIVEILTARGIL
jgi:UTP--glucose-1-phosphate uridylyltransferase